MAERTSAEDTICLAEGYGAFSIGVSQIHATIRYIDTQKEHHRKQSFEDEYRLFLKRHGLEYDERYVFG